MNSNHQNYQGTCASISTTLPYIQRIYQLSGCKDYHELSTYFLHVVYPGRWRGRGGEGNGKRGSEPPIEFYLLFSFAHRKFEAPLFWRKVISLNQTMKIDAHWPLGSLEKQFLAIKKQSEQKFDINTSSLLNKEMIDRSIL